MAAASYQAAVGQRNVREETVANVTSVLQQNAVLVSACFTPHACMRKGRSWAHAWRTVWSHDTSAASCCVAWSWLDEALLFGRNTKRLRRRS